jgi:hypothetical protein
VYDGKTVAKAEENLLVRSQEFDTASWTKGFVTVTADTTTAPDGTSTADTVTEDTSTQSHQLIQTGLIFTNAPTTVSLFVKANGSNTVRILFRTGTAGTVSGSFEFDLSVPSASVTTGSSASASITDAGNGWYRVVATSSDNAASTAVIIRITRLGNSYLGDGTSGLFLWGAQLEQRSAVTAYTPTTTQLITNYIPVLQSAANNVARFDHDPVSGESLGLLVEEQRTNLLLRSEEFDNAAWTKTRASITVNTIVAPDGTLTGDTLVDNTETGSHTVRNATSITITSGTTLTASVYAKLAEGAFISVGIGDGGGVNISRTTFNLSNGSIGISSTAAANVSAPIPVITPVGNGWYRCAVTATVTGVTTAQQWVFKGANSNGNVSYTGDGYSGIYIWGASLEQGSFSTSYIKTEASQVTRSADAASMTGSNFSSWYRQDEGTLLAIASANLSGNRRIAFITDGTASNRIGLLFNSSSRGQFLVFSSGVIQANPEIVGATITSPSLIAGAYKVNDFGVSINGSSVVTDTSGILPVNANVLEIGNQTNGDYLNGHIRKLSFYPQRLSNANLVALTS